ncbi:MAG: hypothetical protein COV74_00725, partial [Candidatus Omnitrophica bacterium CG11_big_fil_rev_8_21_14_0_20_45_26]
VDLNILPEGFENIAALNLEINFDDQVLDFQEVSTGAVGQQAGKTAYAYLRSPGLVRILVLGVNQNTLSEGQLLILTFDVKDGVGHTRTDIRITDPVVVQPDGDNTYSGQVINGTITIGHLQTEIMYIYLNGKRIAHEDEDGKFFYHNDHLGSPVVVSDQYGDKVRYIEYYPFGNTKQEIPGNSQFADKEISHKYNSKELDESTGFYDYGARQYDPSILRFISADPLDWEQEIQSDGNISADEVSDKIRDFGFLGNPQNLNRYSYTLNNPLRYVDLTGKLAVESDTAKRFPKAASFLENLKVRTESEYEAFKRYGQANRSDVDLAFEPGKGPIVKGESLERAFGQFAPGIGSNELSINNKLLGDYETGVSGSEGMLEVTAKHEMTHYFDDLDNIDFPGEEGNSFERDVYGEVVNTYSEAEEIFKKT